MSYFIINTAVANLYKEASHLSEIVTQTIMGESCEIIEKQDEWYKIKQWDNYEGWIYHFHGFESSRKYDSLLYLQDLIGTVFTKDKKRKICTIIYGCGLKTEEQSGGFNIILPDGRKGYSSNNFNRIDKKVSRDKITKTAQRFLGVPYVWGGKTPFGMDCSGFVQTVFKSHGIELPRDAGQQFKILSEFKIEKNKIKKGDLLFFEEKNKITHVAISLGGEKIINSRGYVREESIGKNNSKFDSKLGDLFLHAVSIKQLVVVK